MATLMKSVEVLCRIKTNLKSLKPITDVLFAKRPLCYNTEVHCIGFQCCHRQNHRNLSKYVRNGTKVDSNCLEIQQRNWLIVTHWKTAVKNWGYHPTVKSYRLTRNFSTNDLADGNEKREKENIFTVPNLLTMSRIILTPVIGHLIVHENFMIALGLFTYAGLSDVLDGYIARNFKNQMSALGTALDPLADKFMITVLTVTLTMSELLPVPLACLIIGRDVMLVLSAFVIRYISLPPPRTFKRYFDVTYPTAKFIPSNLSKWNTANQICLVILTLAAPVFQFVDHPVLHGMWYLTAATTVGSGVGYIINRKTSVQYLKDK